MPASHSTRSLSTLEAIVEATRKLLTKKDYGALLMRDVAAEAGVTPGAIYRHFPGKKALVDHVARASLEELQVELLRAAAGHPPGSFDRIVAQGATYIRLAMERPEHFKVLFTPVRPEPTRLSSLPGDGGYRLLRQCIVEAMEAGQIRQVDPDLATFFLWSRVHGIVTLLMACDFSECLPLKKEDITPQRLFELSRELLWEGFKPEVASESRD